MEYTADIEEDVQPEHCFNCKSIVSWIPVSQTVDETVQCERCKQLPSELRRNKAHIAQVRRLREAGELGEQMHFCYTCESQPCMCLRCPHCNRRTSNRYDTCMDCGRPVADARPWFAEQGAIAYCDECGAPEDDCHCEEVCPDCGSPDECDCRL